MTKKYILIVAILIGALCSSGCVQVNNYYCDSADNPTVFNRALSDEEVREIYVSTIQHDCRIATDEGYWYFKDASEDTWAFKDYSQRILITIRTSEANFSEDLKNGFWWIPKNKFEGLQTGDVQFATPDGKALTYDIMEGVLVVWGARTDMWSVGEFTLYKDKDTQLYIYLKETCDPKYKYKEMTFYPKED
jgi:hypothetical protein